MYEIRENSYFRNIILENKIRETVKLMSIVKFMIIIIMFK